LGAKEIEPVVTDERPAAVEIGATTLRPAPDDWSDANRAVAAAEISGGRTVLVSSHILAEVAQTVASVVGFAMMIA
jgi:hypothetical protein